MAQLIPTIGEQIQWAHEVIDEYRAVRGLPAIEWRNRGMEVGKRYCVMCLADGEKTPAVCVVDAAGYCKECAQTMKNNGFKLEPLPAGENQSKSKSRGSFFSAASHPIDRRKVPLTPEERRAIAESKESTQALARRYSTSEQTICNIRNAFKQAAEKQAEWRAQQGPGDPAAGNEAMPAPMEESQPADTVAQVMVPQPENEPISGRVVRVAINFDVTEERADAIWASLSLEEKADFVRGKLLERWPTL